MCGKQLDPRSLSSRPTTEWRRTTEWRAIGESVRGAAHLRSGLVNQDAFHWLPASGVGPPLILVISDGHGSAKYFRSHIGSAQAAERTAWVVRIDYGRPLEVVKR